MAPMTRRRSARLASASKAKQTPKKPSLDSLAEGEESSFSVEDDAQNLKAAMSSPAKPTTPHAGSTRLPMSERHPSKVHQTMAPPSPGLTLGFVDINQDEAERVQPSGITQSTPSKTAVPSSNFTFRVARPSMNDQELGPEAQKMMLELREQAAKIKVELAAQREQQRLEEAEHEGRRIAKAKGRAGRFSQVHMAEFKKMDSIENHPSVARAAANRKSPMKAGIKRSRSKANLNDAEELSPSKVNSAKHPSEHTGKRHRLEEPESPAKRFRQRIEDDTSARRPVSRDDSSIPRPTSKGHDSIRSALPKSRSLAHLMSPTKASAARASANVTPSKTENSILARSPSKPALGSLVRSPSKSELRSPAKPHNSLTLPIAKSPSKQDLGSLARSPSKPGLGSFLKSYHALKSPTNKDSTNAIRSMTSLVQTPGRFDRVKSILKRQFSASKPKSGIPMLACPKTPGNTEKQSRTMPMTTPGQKFGRHVEFTPDTKQAALTQNSPSPTKLVLTRNKVMPAKEPTVVYPFIGASDEIPEKKKGEVSYPDLSAYVTDNDNQEKNEDSEAESREPLPESVPGTFTFRSDKTIRFDGASPRGFGGAAGQSSLRHVRASTMPGSFPTGIDASANKENKDPGRIFAIPHGLSNKKRHVATWDDGEVMDGIAHGVSNKKRHRASSADPEGEDEGAQRPAKKLRKQNPNIEPESIKSPPSNVASPSKRPKGLSHTPSPQKKGLTLSRLNMLARPKVRR